MVALLWTGSSARAQSQSAASAYFHEAAQQYVADDVQEARRTVERGLEVAPSDPRLVALRKKLRQGGQPERDRDEHDSTSTGSNSSGQEGAQSFEGGDGTSSDQNGSAQSGSRNAPRSNGADPRSSSQRRAHRPGRADTTVRGRGGRPVDTLSRAQAERLLRALEGQERRLLRQLRVRSSKRRTVEKDW